MRSVPLRGSPRGRLSRSRRPWAGPLLVSLAVLGLLAVSPAKAGWAGAYGGPYEWTNGVTLCVFSDSLPSVTVSASALNDTGMGAALDQINELSPSGTLVAHAVMNSTAWEPANASSSQWFVMNYTETVNVTSPATPPVPLGSVGITIDFALDRTPANASLAEQVSFQVSVQGWPWQSSLDTLALVVPAWSAFSNSEHIAMGSSSPPRIESVRTSNGQPLEYFEPGLSATTSTGTVVAVSAQTVITAGAATTTLTLGHGAGGATLVTYEATLGITPGTRVLGIPLYDYAAVAGGAGLVALAVGVGARRLRQRPSDLTYVEEPA